MRTVKDRQGFRLAIERMPVGIGVSDMPEESAPRHESLVAPQCAAYSTTHGCR